MKKIVILACSLSLLIACKNKSEETESASTTTATKTDTITKKDSVSANETEEIKKEQQSPEADKKEEASKDIKVETAKDVKVEYASFGSKISADKALTKEEMLNKYKTLKRGDTIAVKFKSRIKDVCKKKGCWMKMDLANNKESFVRFKDYGFFVPLNADNSDAVVSGRAFLDVISVDELKHYAKDGGKSQEEIDKIKDPKVTYAFQADGVLIQK